MASEIRDTTGDTGTGEDITYIGTWRHRTSQDFVADVVETETEITAKLGVRNGDRVQTPSPPTKKDIKLRATDRPVTKEVGWRRQNNGLGDGGTSVMSAIGVHRRRGNIREVSDRRPQENGKSVRSAIGVHKILVRPAIAALILRSAIGAHKI